MDYQGFTVEQENDETTFRVLVGEKVVSVGLPDAETAKAAVDERRRKRERAGLDPVG